MPARAIILIFAVQVLVLALIISGVLLVIWRVKKSKVFIWVAAVVFGIALLFSGTVIGSLIHESRQAEKELAKYEEGFVDGQLLISCEGTGSGGTSIDYFISQEDRVLWEDERFGTGMAHGRYGVKLTPQNPGEATVVMVRYAGAGTLRSAYIYSVIVDDNLEVSYEKETYDFGYDDRLEGAEKGRNLLINEYGCSEWQVEIINDRF